MGWPRRRRGLSDSDVVSVVCGGVMMVDALKSKPLRNAATLI